MYAIILGDLGQRWMNKIDCLVFISSFINDCVIAGDCCDPKMCLLYAYDDTRRISNKINDRECTIMSACIEVANQVESINNLAATILKNTKVLEHVVLEHVEQDKEAFRKEICRKFMVYNTIRPFEPVWNTFKLLKHAVIHHGNVRSAFPLLRFFNDKNVNA